MFLILIVKKKHSHPIDRIRNQLIQLPCSLPKLVMGGDLPLLVVPLLKLVFPLLALSLQELEVDNSGNYVV